MTINDATLSTDVYSEIRTLLVSANLHITNSTTSVETTASVLSTYNDKDNKRPQVIIVPVTKSEDTFAFDGSQGTKMINVLIECYAENSLGVDQLNDQIEYAVKTNKIDGMSLNDITTDYTFNTMSNQKYQQKTITLTYLRR